MNELIFTTNNKNKLKEIKEILKNYKILSLSEINISTSIPEDHQTLKENAIQKASFIYKKTKQNVFSDDTGLEIDSLNGKPGVYSARYAGENCTASDNIKKVLQQIKTKQKRTARFRTIIALIINGKTKVFEGCCEGSISNLPKGEKGFGYDSIFIPKGYKKTFSELGDNVKNKISHRKMALNKLTKFLKS